MSYIILSIIVIGLSFLYDSLSITKTSNVFKILFYIVICTVLCVFAGLRTEYNDTWTYIDNFKYTTNDLSTIFSGEFKISNVYLFRMWNFFVYNFISTNPNIYLGLSSIIFVCPSIYLIQKYSKNFTFSIILYMFAGMFLFSLAGLKQAMATGIILIALPFLFKKNYIIYYIACIISIFFHTYSIFFLIVPLLGIEVFNVRTIIFCVSIVVIGLTLSLFSGVIITITDFLGKDIDEESLVGSVNIFRALVYVVPLVLVIIANKNLSGLMLEEKLLIKIGILSTIFMVLSLFGNPILFGRIPQYFLIGIVVSLPLLIGKIFDYKDQITVTIIATIFYIGYGVYGLSIDGAFTNDIFKLIWF